MNRKTEALILGFISFLLMMCVGSHIKLINFSVKTSPETLSLKNEILKIKEKYEGLQKKLEKQAKELESERTKVASNNDELKSLEERIKKVNILLGTIDVKGPGVTITIDEETIDEKHLLDIVNELKNSGSEAIEINGKRLTNLSSIIKDGDIILIDGEKITGPYIINAIGDQTLLEALNRPGGEIYVLLTYYEIEADLKKVDSLAIKKYDGTQILKYAEIVNN